MMGQLESVGRVDATYDYHGVINISKIRITFPYHRVWRRIQERMYPIFEYVHRAGEI